MHARQKPSKSQANDEGVSTPTTSRPCTPPHHPVCRLLHPLPPLLPAPPLPGPPAGPGVGEGVAGVAAAAADRPADPGSDP